MIDIIYVQSNASHPAGFTYTVTDQSNDWWLITMTHTPAYHIIDGKRIIMPAHSITLYPPYSSIEYGSLEKGKKANVVLLEPDLTLKCVIKDGKQI